MSSKLVLLLCAGFVFAAISAFAATANEYPFEMSGFTGEGIALDVSRTSPEHTTIILNNPDIRITETPVDFGALDMISLEGEPYLPVPGSPAVPQVSRFYRIPNTGGVDLIIRNAEYEVLEGIEAYPYIEEGRGFNRDARDPVAYGKDSWYPPEIAVMSDPMIFRDFRVVTMALRPVQVNPVTGQARIYSNIEVDIVANAEPGYNELLNPRLPSGAYASIYRQMIENLDEHALDNATTTPGTYLIITENHSAVNTATEQLATWKQRKGFDVVIEQRANWNSPAQVASFIRGFAVTADPPLEYVCLMGDPQASFGIPTDGSWGEYDHMYALANTADRIEDWGVGRLSGNSEVQMATIMAKILNYESNPYMDETEWFTSSFLYGGVANQIASNYTLMQWTGEQFARNTGIVNNDVQWVNGHVNNSLVQQKFAEGICVFLWRGTWLSQMESSLANSCNSGWKLPVVLTVTCGSGDFDFGLGTQEAFLVAGTPGSPKGGICAIGTATTGTHAPQNITFTGGLAHAMAVLEIEHIGHALNAAKLWLTRTWGPGSNGERDFSRWNNLMGDPALSYWTDIPVILDVSHPTTLNVGAREVTVSVFEEASGEPVEDALVVLWKGELENPESYTKLLTDGTGTARLPVTTNSAGTLMLTVTKRNHKPHLYDIPVVAADQMVTFEGVSIDDDNAGGTSGNNNNQYNPGETIDLGISLKNHGTGITATDVTATLSSPNSNVTVLNESSTYPDIAPGGTADGTVAFRIQISPTMKHGHAALLDLAVTASTIVTHSAVEVTCHAGSGEYIQHQFIGGSFNPGTTRDLQVTVRNDGDLEMQNVTARLISQSPFVSADVFEVSFGNIAVGAQVTNSGDRFELTANTLTYPGHQAPLLLILETSGGYIDTVQFSVHAGTASTGDPTGPDAYGYYAYENVDTDYEHHPDFDYVNISSGLGTDLNLNDVGEKTTVSQIWSTVRSLPFEFTYYGETYDQVTICSNGWLAFGDQGWNDNFRNFPIPAMVGANAMISPYWDDLKTSGGNQGVWEYYDAANHRYVVQWKAGGGGSSYNQSLDFQVILYDPFEHPTLDGNGPILFQYQDIPGTNLPGNRSEQTGCSIGIQDGPGLIGLELTYQNDRAPGVSTFSDGRAILITTDARALFGVIEGTVTDAATGLPMEDVVVTLDGFNYHDETDAQGNYRIENVLIGQYTVRASEEFFNETTVSNVIVELDSTETIDFAMLHPEFELSTSEIFVSLPDDPPETSFEIINDGNGPLDYRIEIVYTGGGDPVDPWGSLDQDIAVTELTGDNQILGCEFIGDYWWVSGGRSIGGDNRLYKFDLEGNFVESIPQPSSSDFGWFDLAYDGDYLYGSEDGTGVIHGIDMEGSIQATIPSPMNPSRAITYDPATDHFWVADFTQDIYEIDRQGDVFTRIHNDDDEPLQITGLAWNPTAPDGYKLLVFSQNGSDNQTLVTRVHPLSYDMQQVTVLEGQPGDRAGGCAMTGGWNSTLLVFGAIIQNSEGDRLALYQVDFNTIWINVSPMVSMVDGGTRREVAVSFDTGILRPATYRVSLLIYNDVLDTELDLPVVLDVATSADPEPAGAGIPRAYALRQNYPNPFNPSTTIAYDLKTAGHTTLSVYNLVGQEVARLVNGPRAAGSHAVHFTADRLPSGVYFYRLTSGDFTRTAKMILMK